MHSDFPFSSDAERGVVNDVRGNYLGGGDSGISARDKKFKINEPMRDESIIRRWWPSFSKYLSFLFIPPPLLKKWIKDHPTQQAFREKLALCALILLLCLILSFFTFAMGKLLCPASEDLQYIPIDEFQSSIPSNTWFLGSIWKSDTISPILIDYKIPLEGRNIIENVSYNKEEVCNSLLKSNLPPRFCKGIGNCIPYQEFTEALPPPHKRISYQWSDLTKRNIFVLDGLVINIDKLPEQPFIDQEINDEIQNSPSKDLSLSFSKRKGDLSNCLKTNFQVGFIDTLSVGCFSFQLLQSIVFFILVFVMIFQFVTALTFRWILRKRLSEDLPLREVKVETTSPILEESMLRWLKEVDHHLLAEANYNLITDIRVKPFVMVLVTCYSESSSSIRQTLKNITESNYSKSRILICIIGDGQIIGEDSTNVADEILEIIAVPNSNPPPFPYESISNSEDLRVNTAKIHTSSFNEFPVIFIEKCGNSGETKRQGNRGKRDSQIILMSFLQKILSNDRLSPMEYDLFTKIYWLMGVSADIFDLLLMVDSDTLIDCRAITYMVRAMASDPMVMGLCGETKVANKRTNWVTKIQVFEYYINHHMGKAFESVFGGVTCLPGCFSMYRIKGSPLKKEEWNTRGLIPILANPILCSIYREDESNTLHQKNLLLLGEDRYLSTILLSTFPKRKMIFVPQAHCMTQVPDSFKILLSQRRRWINSTIHNLMELLQVRDLCGIFCCSMQFVIFMQLLGSILLPAAIIFTFILIIQAFIEPKYAVFPLILLAMVLGLPIILILFTTRRIGYVWWCLWYIAALPVWNFILPLYAFWHFDDFSWGQTRRVGHVHGENDERDGSGEDKDSPDLLTLDSPDVPMRSWEYWATHDY